jgi:hypothetical protein
MAELKAVFQLCKIGEKEGLLRLVDCHRLGAKLNQIKRLF